MKPLYWLFFLLLPTLAIAGESDADRILSLSYGPTLGMQERLKSGFNGGPSQLPAKSIQLDYGITLNLPANCCQFHDAEDTKRLLIGTQPSYPPGTLSIFSKQSNWLILLTVERVEDPIEESHKRAQGAQPLSSHGQLFLPAFQDGSDGYARWSDQRPPLEAHPFGTVREWFGYTSDQNNLYVNHYVSLSDMNRRLNAVLVVRQQEYPQAFLAFRKILGDMQLKPLPKSTWMDLLLGYSWLLLFPLALMGLLIQSKRERYDHIFDPSKRTSRAFGMTKPSSHRGLDDKHNDRPDQALSDHYVDESQLPAIYRSNAAVLERIQENSRTRFQERKFRPQVIKHRRQRPLDGPWCSISLPKRSVGELNPVVSIRVLAIGGAGINVLESVQAVRLPLTEAAALDNHNQQGWYSFRDDIDGIAYPIYHGFSSKPLALTSAYLRMRLAYGPGFQLAGAHRALLMEEERRSIEALLDGIEFLILLANPGSFSTYKVLPKILEIARNKNIPAYGIFSTPFSKENTRVSMAKDCLVECIVQGLAYSTFENDNLPRIFGNHATMYEAMRCQANWMALLAWTLTHLWENDSTRDGLRQHLGNWQGRVPFAYAQAVGLDNLDLTVSAAFTNPLLQSVDLTKHDLMLVVITGTKLEAQALQSIEDALQIQASHQTHEVINLVRADLDDQIYVVLLATHEDAFTGYLDKFKLYPESDQP